MPVFIIAGIVFISSRSASIWLFARFRRNRDDEDGVDEPVQQHGKTPLEIGWTIVPALLLAVLAVFNVQTHPPTRRRQRRRRSRSPSSASSGGGSTVRHQQRRQDRHHHGDPDGDPGRS